MLIALSLGGSADAQDLGPYGGYLDATGYQAAPTDGSTTDPLLLWRVGASSKNSYALGGQLEHLRSPLVLYTQRYTVDGQQRSPRAQRVIGGLTGLRFSALWQPGSRVGLGLSLPVWGVQRGMFPDELGESTAYVKGPALGDSVLSVPVGLRRLGAEGRGLALGVVPTLTLPTGAGGRGVSDRRVGSSLLFTGSLVGSKFSVDLNAGIRRRVSPPQERALPVSGHSGVVAGVSVAYAATEQLALLLGAHADGALQATYSNPASLPDVPADHAVVPAEISVGVRGQRASGLFWSAGLAVGGGGPGASAPHLLGGMGWRRGPAATAQEHELDPAAVLQVFEVVDPAGAPVVSAVISDPDETLGTTSAEGLLSVHASTIDWSKVTVSAPGYIADQRIAEPSDTGAPVRVQLDWALTPVELQVRDQSGSGVVANVRIAGLEHALFTTNEQGIARFELPPGEWRATISAPQLGEQARAFWVKPGRHAAQSAEVLLLPQAAGLANLELSVMDRSGEPVAGASVRLDGMPVGSSASGGRLHLQQLTEGLHQLDVMHTAYQTLQLDQVVLETGDNLVTVPLARLPGSVKVVARSGEAVVPDATVRFDGPSRLPPAELGADGERVFVVRPGSWSVLVASPSVGLQSRQVEVPPERTALTLVDVNLLTEGGAADLSLQIVDPEGAPVNAARVELDGRSLGYTSTGGTMEVVDLNVGARSLSLQADHMRPIDDAELFVLQGQQHKLITMDWQPGSTRVRALRSEGFVSDAAVNFSGPAPTEPVELGPFGEHTLQLAPGAWSALLVSPQHGLAARSLQIPPDSRRLQQLDIYLDGGEQSGAASVTIAAVDPEGFPASGLTAHLDDHPIGTVMDGLLSLHDIGSGERSLELSGSPFQVAERDLVLVDGDNEVMVDLAWAPGAVKVITREPDGTPVTDATIALTGPAQLPPARVDERGVRLVQLSPGQWQALVVSPAYGFVTRSVSIAPEQESLEVVEFDVVKVGEGRAELLVRVVDPAGRPVAGAEVLFDDRVVGVTGAGGLFLLDDAAPGQVSFEVRAAGYAATTTTGLHLRAGSQDRRVELDVIPVPLQISVTDREGAPVQASVQFRGASDVASITTDSAGIAQATLRPGKWTVLASAEKLGVKSTKVELKPGVATREITLALDVAKVKVTQEQMVIDDKVRFAFERASLQPSADRLLDEVASTLIASPQVVRVEVQGHTDSVGSASFNLDLSDRRARAVYDALVERGVPPERLISRGYGATRPIASNSSDSGRAQNRRVQFQILEQTSQPSP